MLFLSSRQLRPLRRHYALRMIVSILWSTIEYFQYLNDVILDAFRFCFRVSVS